MTAGGLKQSYNFKEIKVDSKGNFIPEDQLEKLRGDYQNRGENVDEFPRVKVGQKFKIGRNWFFIRKITRKDLVVRSCRAPESDFDKTAEEQLISELRDHLDYQEREIARLSGKSD
jgi:hypothetical protein